MEEFIKIPSVCFYLFIFLYSKLMPQSTVSANTLYLINGLPFESLIRGRL